MSDDLKQSDGDPLDELLASAAWPEPTPQQMARLVSTWNRARPRLFSPKLPAVIAAAAAVIVGIVVWNSVIDQRKPARALPVAAQDSTPAPLPDLEPPAPALSDALSRPPTPWELVLLRVAEQRAARERRRVETDPLERAIARLIEDPDPPIDELWSASGPREDLTARITQELPLARGARRIALAQLLIAVEPPDALPILLSLWSDALTRSLVEPAVVRAADAPTLANLLNSRLSFDERVRLLSEIAARSDREALMLLAIAARDFVFRPAAFAALKHTAPPAELLLSLISEEDPDVRAGAALLVGEHGDSQLTDDLIALIRENPAHSELWLALMQRSDPEASAFLAAARRHPQVMATVHLAEAARQTLVAPVQVGVPL